MKGGWFRSKTALFGLFLVSQAALAADLIKVPANTDCVVDEAGLLSGSARQQISASLHEFQSEVGAQLQLLTVPELGGEPIENFSLRVVEAWKPGQKKLDNGILLLIAQKEHKVRIEVGQGLEGQLPDIVAGRIISNVIVPRFKAQDFAGGIVAGLSAIAHGVGGELRNAPSYQSRRGRAPGSSNGLFLVLIVLFLVLSRFGNSRSGGFGSFLGGMLLGEVLSSGRRGGGFGGGDGGGFSGGGGGGFSGGGASGDW